jgi:hypothetical protein
MPVSFPPVARPCPDRSRHCQLSRVNLTSVELFRQWVKPENVARFTGYPYTNSAEVIKRNILDCIVQKALYGASRCTALFNDNANTYAALLSKLLLSD